MKKRIFNHFQLYSKRRPSRCVISRNEKISIFGFIDPTYNVQYVLCTLYSIHEKYQTPSLSNDATISLHVPPEKEAEYVTVDGLVLDIFV